MAKIAIRTEADLVKYVIGILGDQWSITIHETLVTDKYRHITRITKRNFWWISVNCYDPITIGASFVEPTLPQLIKSVLNNKLWEKIREEFLKQSVQWQKPGEPEAIGTGQRKLTAKRPGIAQKQAALSHKLQALPATSKQLLLLPAAAVGPTCHWPGCGAGVHEQAWACCKHWQMLTPRVQDVISQKYRPGLIQSAEYADVEEFALRWIEATYPELIHS